MKENYAITITPTFKKPVRYAEDFDFWIENLNTAGIQVVARRFEIKKDNTLHLHMACIGPQGLYYQKLQRKGWQVYVKPIYDGPGWLDYINKTSSNEIEESQLLEEHKARHNNLFTFNLDEM